MRKPCILETVGGEKYGILINDDDLRRTLHISRGVLSDRVAIIWY